ncbi:mannosyltransferase [Fusarium irregulare]|uniref:Mannosyltransferase n=1 Tax=Fusarium irregulare TaxID=2494466 RepID=A0A9W8UDV0_9HYPO|nr:mannosyltransferase [Fusarium irregulare]KAJ4020708.1 mannosyltransferase [Fusarium irregulare]
MAPGTAPQAQQQRQFVHPTASHAKKKAPSAYSMQPISAFYWFFAAALVSAWFAPIQDCDETFNYWEPTHYLSHGYGLQTWEYSPDYAIRSWLYIAFHAIVGNVRRLFPHSNKVAEFYFVRFGLAFVCAITQTILFMVTSTTLNSRIGLFFLMATVASPGNFHASTAFLPSSFAMYLVTVGAAAFMNWRGGLKTSQGIFWFAAAGVLGWPFAAALCAPFMFEELLLLIFGDKTAIWEGFIRIGRGVVSAMLLLAGDYFVNLFFYKKAVSVTWNIVKYNIFSSDHGPELYGTEPWTFYFKNLALNFNLWFVLALAALPLFILQKIISPSGQGFQTGLRTVVFLSPFYMWLGIFSAQPHKEERFMYPAYPFLALNAAISTHMILTALGNSDPKTLVGKVPAKLKLVLVAITVILSVDVALLRVYGIWSAYSAPMKIYTPLWEGKDGSEPIGREEDTVCFGKEWYRFPSSYFLPRDMHAKFIRSEFKGLLPGEFAQAETGFGFWSGTWLPTFGMNDRNEEDLSKYTELPACKFIVDTQYPLRIDPLPPNEPDYIEDHVNWEVVKCELFLDAANTHLLARTLWVPDLAFIPDKFKRKWGRHCLLQRKKPAIASSASS